MSSKTPVFTIKDKAVEVFTEFYYSSYPGADDLEYLAPATVFYKNAYGGTICSMAFHHAIAYSQFNVGRREFLIEIIEKLRNRKMPVLCTDEQNITVITREYEDKSILCEVCNINFDPLKEISLRCAEVPEKIEYLAGDGTWHDMPFTLEDDTVKIKHTLACYELMIFKIS